VFTLGKSGWCASVPGASGPCTAPFGDARIESYPGARDDDDAPTGGLHPLAEAVLDRVAEAMRADTDSGGTHAYDYTPEGRAWRAAGFPRREG
jgi:hypothetical protein